MVNQHTLTIFSAPRAFRGQFDTLQRNSIKSWLALEPRPDVVLFGDESGTGDVCRELGVRWIPDVAVTPKGLPVLSDLIAKADAHSATPLLAYVNIDIILLQDVVDAIERAHAVLGPCVLIGTPRNVRVPDGFEALGTTWATDLRQRVEASGASPTERGADVFVYPRGYFADAPPIALGRFFFDNWLMSRARFGPLPDVDITEAATIVHQDHSGSSHGGRAREGSARVDADTLTNRANTTWWERNVFRRDIPLVLTADGGVRRRPLRGRAALAPKLVFRHAAASLLDVTGPVRHRLGLYRWWRRS